MESERIVCLTLTQIFYNWCRFLPLKIITSNWYQAKITNPKIEFLSSFLRDNFSFSENPEEQKEKKTGNSSVMKDFF